MSKFDPELGRRSPVSERKRRYGLIEGETLPPRLPGVAGYEIEMRNLSVEAHQRLRAAASDLLRKRKMRRRFVPEEIFGEVAWDALLHLYVHDVGRRQTVSELAAAVPAPHTTLLRWLSFFEKKEITRSRSSPLDRRVRFIELTAAGRSALDQYLVEILRLS